MKRMEDVLKCSNMMLVVSVWKFYDSPLTPSDWDSWKGMGFRLNHVIHFKSIMNRNAFSMVK